MGARGNEDPGTEQKNRFDGRTSLASSGCTRFLLLFSPQLDEAKSAAHASEGAATETFEYFYALDPLCGSRGRPPNLSVDNVPTKL